MSNGRGGRVELFFQFANRWVESADVLQGESDVCDGNLRRRRGLIKVVFGELAETRMPCGVVGEERHVSRCEIEKRVEDGGTSASKADCAQDIEDWRAEQLSVEGLKVVSCRCGHLEQLLEEGRCVKMIIERTVLGQF